MSIFICRKISKFIKTIKYRDGKQYIRPIKTFCYSYIYWRYTKDKLNIIKNQLAIKCLVCNWEWNNIPDGRCTSKENQCSVKPHTPTSVRD